MMRQYLLMAMTMLWLLSACGEKEEASIKDELPEGTIAADPAPEPVTRPGPDEPDISQPDPVPVPNLPVLITTEGLAGIGNSADLKYGVPQAMVLEAVKKQLGVPNEIAGNAECGAGPIQMALFDSIRLHFQDGNFMGWFLEDGSTLKTPEGIGLGSSWAAVKSVYSNVEEVTDSTIGREFFVQAGEYRYISGLLDSDGDDARVSDLWSGTVCIFR